MVTSILPAEIPPVMKQAITAAAGVTNTGAVMAMKNLGAGVRAMVTSSAGATNTVVGGRMKAVAAVTNILKEIAVAAESVGVTNMVADTRMRTAVAAVMAVTMAMIPSAEAARWAMNTASGAIENGITTKTKTKEAINHPAATRIMMSTMKIMKMKATTRMMTAMAAAVRIITIMTGTTGRKN